MMNRLDTAYPIMEYFYSIQGEGNFTGRPAVFIRFGGCDVGCVWCDVKESWEAENHPTQSVAELLEFCKSNGANFVVITGGEPAMYDLNALIKVLKSVDIYTAIETSGVYELKGNVDWVCFSPKKFKKPLPEIYGKADELKVIVFHPSDLVWAQEHAEKVTDECKLYLQAEWSKSKEITPLILEFIKKNPVWNLSIQTHKYIDVP